MPVPRGAFARLTTPLLVGLVVAASVVLTRPAAAPLSTSAVVTSARASEVCVDADVGPLCWDAEHVDHLLLTRVRTGQCLTVVYTARWAPGTVTEVDATPCPG